LATRDCRSHGRVRVGRRGQREAHPVRSSAPGYGGRPQAPVKNQNADIPPVTEVRHIMKQIMAGLIGLVLALVSQGTAEAYSHANRFGGSSSHSFGSTSHSSTFGTSTSHVAGVGTSHSNAYG